MGLNLFSHAADGCWEEARVVVPLADAAPSVGPRAVLTGDCHASIFRILGGIAPRARVGRPVAGRNTCNNVTPTCPLCPDSAALGSHGAQQPHGATAGHHFAHLRCIGTGIV